VLEAYTRLRGKAQVKVELVRRAETIALEYVVK
jgi:hypothetical protein